MEALTLEAFKAGVNGQPVLVEGIPARGRRVETRQSLGFLPTQTLVVQLQHELVYVQKRPQRYYARRKLLRMLQNWPVLEMQLPVQLQHDLLL